MRNTIPDPATLGNIFALFPLHRNSKRPAIDEWQMPEARAAYDWTSHTGNVGGVIGPDHLVLDIDPRNGGAESFQQLKQDFPEFQFLYSASVYTSGGGAHFYFRLPPSFLLPQNIKITKTLPQYPGLDWLHGNRYVVLPGSTLQGTPGWRWSEAGPVTSPPWITSAILAELFTVEEQAEDEDHGALWGLLTADELGELLAELDVTQFASDSAWLELMSSCHHATAGEGAEEFLAWSEGDPAYIDQRQMNEQRWESMSAEGPSGRPITARTLTRCFDVVPPWLAAKLRCPDPSALFKPLPSEEAAPEPRVDTRQLKADYTAKINAEEDDERLAILWATIAADAHVNEITKEKLGRLIAKKSGCSWSTLKRVVATQAKKIAAEARETEIDEGQAVAEVAKKTLQALGGEGNVLYQGGDFWRYDKTHWERVDHDAVRPTINKVIRNLEIEHFLTGPFLSSADAVLRTLMAPKPPGFWNPASAGVEVNTSEGVLKLTGDGRWQRLPHNKSHRMNYVLPVAPQQMETPVFDYFMESSLGGDEQTRRTLLAAMVYTVVNRQPWWKKCFFLHGTPDSGKSQFIHLLKALVAPEQQKSLSLRDLGNRFLLSELHGKLLNTYGEVDTAALDSQTFKVLVGGDELTADRKNIGSVTFRNSATFWFAGNNWPKFRDESSASLNRVTVIEFPHSFSTAQQDPALELKLVRELPGIFYEALQVFAEEYVKDEGMTIRMTPEASRSALARFKNTSHPVRLWALDRLEPAGEGELTVDQIYQDYRAWAKANGHQETSKNGLSQRLAQVPALASAREERRGGARTFLGVSLKNIFQEAN